MSAKDLKPYIDALSKHGGNAEKDASHLMESRNFDNIDKQKLISDIKSYLVYGRISDRERRGYLMLLDRLGKKPWFQIFKIWITGAPI